MQALLKQNCFEAGNCPFTNPLELFTMPFTHFFGDFFFVMVWGVVLAVMFLKNKDPMLTSLVGILIAGFFSGSSVLTNSATAQAFNIGWILVAISVGMFMWFTIQKARNPVV